ncbi:hypothetical protein GGR57DRAFT_470905 [Xylariaceae sp. FL1272]|nr:hypothetical protein GGR57DRAFT_470905 [Xylariaceae sp. FL1272]
MLRHIKKLRQKLKIRRERSGGQGGTGSAKTTCTEDEVSRSDSALNGATRKCEDPDHVASPIPPAVPVASAKPALFLGKQTRGLQVLKTPPNDGGIDIIFVHGLTGDSHRTWLHPSGIYWPTDLLSQDIPTARILSFGYDADVAKVAGAVGQGNLRNHASTLVAEYAALRAEDAAQSRALVLVAHSLGGLVVKKALCVAAESAFHHHGVLHRDVVGLCFLGTPHRGSDLADYASIVTRILKITGKRVNEVIVDVLRPDSEVLTDVQESFGMWWVKNQHRCYLSCFYEEHEVAGIGMIVPKKSANLEGSIPLPIPSDHRDMARFASTECLGYKRVLGQIKFALDRHEIHQELEDPSIETKTKSGFEDHKKWLKVLAFPQLHTRRNNISAAAPKTCGWILAHPTYHEWLNNPHPPLLWLLGHPGTGKSTLMKYLSRRSGHDILSNPGNSFVASFFFDNLGTTEQKTANGLYRSLLFQILEAFPSSARSLSEHNIHLEADAEPDEILKGFSFPQVLENALNIVLNDAHVWIFIDALDECKPAKDEPEHESEEARSIIRAFASLQQNLESSARQLRICCSCRHYPSFVKAAEAFQICTEEENEEDIKEFIKCELRGEIDETEANITGRIQSAIAKNAGGSFQWTKLVTDTAMRQYHAGKSTAQILKQIRTTPRQLSMLYLEILKSIPAEDRDRSAQLFRCAIFPLEPLNVLQLQRLMNVRAYPAEGKFRAIPKEDTEYVESEAHMRRLVQSLSGGLAVFRPQSFDQSVSDYAGTRSSSSNVTKLSSANASQYSFSDHDSEGSESNKPVPHPQFSSDRLYLMHQSVLGYMVKEGLQYLLDHSNSSGSLFYDCHMHLCLSYAAGWDSISTLHTTLDQAHGQGTYAKIYKFSNKYPTETRKCNHLVDYRATKKYRALSAGIDPGDLRAVAQRAFPSTRIPRDTWIDMFVAMAELEIWSRYDPASVFDPLTWAFHHLEEARSFETCDGDAEGAFIRCLQTQLIAHPKSFFFSVTIRALQFDVPQVLSAVIQLVPPVNYDDLDYPWVFRVTIAKELFENMKVLLNHKNIAERAIKHSCALITAVKSQQLEVARFLLDKGFDPNQMEVAGSKKGWSALGLAVQREDGRMCSLLLEYGADAHLPDDRGQTPLMLVWSAQVFNPHLFALLAYDATSVTPRRKIQRTLHYTALDSDSTSTFYSWLDELTTLLPYPHEDLTTELQESVSSIHARYKPQRPDPFRDLSHIKSTYRERAAAAVLIREGVNLRRKATEKLNTLTRAVGANWVPHSEAVTTLLSTGDSKCELAYDLDVAGRTALDWALDYYSYIRTELGESHPAVRDEVIWQEEPYHPQFKMDPPFKLGPREAVKAIEESKIIVRQLRAVDAPCGECRLQVIRAEEEKEEQNRVSAMAFGMWVQSYVDRSPMKKMRDEYAAPEDKGYIKDILESRRRP